ncbi:MAG: SlyX protein [Paracoccus denitrificans]|nr:MAG: SlyX protein [Paracoccus denitrificans]PZO83417.1 MAG: SlyX protein [Paracoccus denitrificans]
MNKLPDGSAEPEIPSDDPRWLGLEERISHLMRMLDDLSDVVARQDAEIDRLTRHVGLLMQREAEQETAVAIPLADQRPPHW